MSIFKKEQPRLTVKFIDSANNSLLFEVNDRDHMNVGDMFSDAYATALINQTIPHTEQPEAITVLVVATYHKQ